MSEKKHRRIREEDKEGEEEKVEEKEVTQRCLYGDATLDDADDSGWQSSKRRWRKTKKKKKDK